MIKERTDWDRFVNVYFLPEDEVGVSDCFLITFIFIITQFFVLFVGWCAKGFSLAGLMKDGNPASPFPISIFLLAVAIIFFVFYFVFRVIKGLTGFVRHKTMLQRKHREWEYRR